MAKVTYVVELSWREMKLLRGGLFHLERNLPPLSRVNQGHNELVEEERGFIKALGRKLKDIKPSREE